MIIIFPSVHTKRAEQDFIWFKMIYIGINVECGQVDDDHVNFYELIKIYQQNRKN